MSRAAARAVLPVLAAAFACLHFSGPVIAAPDGRAPLCAGATLGAAEVEEVAPGLFVRQGVDALMSAQNSGAIANIGFIIGERAVAVIDSGGSYCDGERLRLAVRAHSGLPIAYVINTHVHPDHIFGNAAFADQGAVFVGHRNLEGDMAARGDYYMRAFTELMGAAAIAGTKIIPPGEAVDGESVLDLGGRKLILTAHRKAHTGSDLSVYDEKTRTLWAGDLVFLHHIPVLDGNLRGWQAVMDDLAKLPALRVVPGHGPVAAPWPEALKAQRRYFETLAADLRSYIDAGGGMIEASKHIAVEEAARWTLHGDFHERNVNKGFAELEWE
jgi:quinoprotein relay system zinc metallohydrolase 2